MGYLQLSPTQSSQLSKGVDMSKVTQAASQSNLSGKGYAPSSSNPSTSIYNAGKSPYPSLTQFGQQNLQNMPIPGPNLPSGGGGGGNSGPGGPGPGGISNGSYEPQNLTQDQRQWLWEQNGHKGIAPVGYGGESKAPLAPPSEQGNQIISFLPSFVPPPTPTPSATMVPRPASGATAPQQSLSTGGGVAGQAFNVLSQLAQGTKGLQLPGLASGALSALQGLPGNVAEAIGTFAPQFAQGSTAPSFTGTQTQKSTSTPGYYPEQDRAAEGNAGDVLAPQAKMAKEFIKQAWPFALPEVALPFKALSKALPIVERMAPEASWLMSNLIGRGTQWLGGRGVNETINPKETGATYTKQGFGTVDTRGQLTKTPQNTQATSGNILGNIPLQQAPEAISTALNNPKQVDTIASGIASEEVKPIIANMMQTASEQGNMGAVQTLAQLYTSVQRQLDFNKIIQQAVQAISGGFGSPQDQSITEARTPMVQTGIGQGLQNLATGVSPAPTMPYQQGGSQVQQLPFQLPSVPQTQQNKPLLNPFMGSSYG